MMTELLMPAILSKVRDLAPITLAEMESVRLMNRIDSKFVIPATRLPQLLGRLKEGYRIAEIDGHRICQYQTLYYDTPDLMLYKEHLGGRLNRYKVRQRSYVESRLSFTEVKLKNNKGRTIKNRIRIKSDRDRFDMQQFDPESSCFLSGVLPFDPTILRAVLRVDYQRITLVNHDGTERVTLDLNISFHNNSDRCAFSHVVIAEVKQDKSCASRFTELMKNEQFRKGSLSKYCIGIISLYPHVRYNRFKRRFNHFYKLNRKNDGHTPANTFPGLTSGIRMV
jgi:hypothetical protein